MRKRYAWPLAALLYVAWWTHCELTGLWSRFSEPLDYECDRPALPANQSGLKIIIAGLAKTGTRSMSRALFRIGMGHSYHSEEFNLFVWSKLADKYWLKKSGGSWSGLPRPGKDNTSDSEALLGTSSEELAAGISRCGVDAVAFDGIESLILPIYKVSPGAKVIVLNWRTFSEWRTSLENFVPLLMLELMSMGLLCSSLTVLPWGALFQVVDPLLGRRMETMLRTGGPPICQVYDLYTSLFHSIVNFRRIASHWSSGLQYQPSTAEEYDEFFRSVKEVVPPENLFEWDMRKHTYEDLCRIAGVDSCPESGRLPRVLNAFIFVRDFPETFARKLLVLLPMHYINWKIFRAVASMISRLVWGRPKVS